MEYNLPYPQIWHRSKVERYELHRGSVVAFMKYEFEKQRTGIIIMDDKQMMLAAVNLYKETGRIWCQDYLPDNIELFEANKAETLWGYQFFLEEECEQNISYKDKNPYIAFIENECQRTDCGYGHSYFCQDLLSYVPKMLDQSEWPALKQLLWQSIQKSGGLQFDRLRTEYYCYLIGVLMIAESASDDYTYDNRIKQFKKEWYQLSWMYGMAIGRVVGTALNNFTAVVKQAGQGWRKHYLHLYLPLVENNVDKICRYSNDNRYKLEDAIRQMRVVEAREEQKTDIDNLYGILFPKHFLHAMSSSRPAATIADLKEEVVAKDQRIKELEDAVDDVTNKYNNVLEQLKDAVKYVESDKFSPENLTAAFLRFPTELALSFYGSMSTLMALDATWQKYAPKILERILAQQKERQERQEQKQDKMIEEVEKAANKPTTQNIYGDKNEFQEGAQLLKMGIPEGADPAEIAARIAEQQQTLLEQKKQKK